MWHGPSKLSLGDFFWILMLHHSPHNSSITWTLLSRWMVPGNSALFLEPHFLEAKSRPKNKEVVSSACWRNNRGSPKSRNTVRVSLAPKTWQKLQPENDDSHQNIASGFAGRRIRTAVRTGRSDGWSTKKVHSIKLGNRIFTIVQWLTLTSRNHIRFWDVRVEFTIVLGKKLEFTSFWFYVFFWKKQIPLPKGQCRRTTERESGAGDPKNNMDESLKVFGSLLQSLWEQPFWTRMESDLVLHVFAYQKTEVSDISMAFLGGRIIVPQTFPNHHCTNWWPNWPPAGCFITNSPTWRGTFCDNQKKGANIEVNWV